MERADEMIVTDMRRERERATGEVKIRRAPVWLRKNCALLNVHFSKRLNSEQD